MFRMLLLIFAIMGGPVLAFTPIPTNYDRQYSRSVRIFGISEWRDQVVVESPWNVLGESFRCSNHEAQSDSCRTVPVHLVGSNQVALLGEMLYLQFTKDDEVRLFQQAIDCHQGVFGLGFVSKEDGIVYDKISLVEIKDYNMIGGDFGIFLSVQVVGRAMLLESELTTPVHTSSRSLPLDDHEDKQPLVALCIEILNHQEQVSLAEVAESGKAVEKLIGEICIAENGSDGVIRESQNRWDRFQEAYHQALESDTQGYIYSDRDSRELVFSVGEVRSQHYTWKELNALSWAAFSTSASVQQDETYRLAALDNDYMTNRLLLAIYWLSDVLQDVQQGAI